MREDWLWIVPSVVIAYLQVKVIWGRLPEYTDRETDVAGDRSNEYFLLYTYVENTIKLVMLIQWAVILFPITSGARLYCLGLVGYCLLIFGFIVSVIALKQLGSNWSGMAVYRIKKNQLLVKDGIYKWVRHPIYSGLLFEIVGYELIVNSWLVIPIFALAFWYISNHIVSEDDLLEKHYKSDFVDYKKRVKKLIPWIY